MSRSTEKHKIYRSLFIFTFIIVVVILSSFNIYLFFKPNKVLGISTSLTRSQISRNVFWDGFLEQNPKYIPGLIETGQTQKAKEIDPNYINP